MMEKKSDEYNCGNCFFFFYYANIYHISLKSLVPQTMCQFPCGIIPMSVKDEKM